MAVKKTEKETVVETPKKDTTVLVELLCEYGNKKPNSKIKLPRDEAESLIKMSFAKRG